MPISLEAMLGAIPRARPGLLDGLKQIGIAMQEKKRRQAQQQMAADRLAYDREQLAADTAHREAVLGENTRHNQAVEAGAADERAQALAMRRHQAIAAVRDQMLKAGNNPEALRSAQAQLKPFGVDLSEEMEEETAIPDMGGLESLMGLPGMDIGANPVPTGRQLGTGRFRLRAGDEDLGSFDVPGLAQAQSDAVQPALDELALGGVPGISDKAYQRGARVAAKTPGLTPGEAVKSATDIAQPEARDATSMVNAQRQAQSQSERFGAGMDIRRDKEARLIVKGHLDRAAQYNKVPALRQSANDGARVLELLKQARTNDETGLMAANAIGQLVKATSGARYSDADLKLMTTAFGKQDEWAQNINNFVKSGKRTDLQMRALERMGKIARLNALRELKFAGEQAYNQVISDKSLTKYATPEEIKSFANGVRRAIEGGAADPASGELMPEPAGGGASRSRSRSSAGMAPLPEPEEEPDGLEGLYQ